MAHIYSAQTQAAIQAFLSLSFFRKISEATPPIPKGKLKDIYNLEKEVFYYFVHFAMPLTGDYPTF